MGKPLATPFIGRGFFTSTSVANQIIIASTKKMWVFVNDLIPIRNQLFDIANTNITVTMQDDAGTGTTVTSTSATGTVSSTTTGTSSGTLSTTY